MHCNKLYPIRIPKKRSNRLIFRNKYATLTSKTEVIFVIFEQEVIAFEIQAVFSLDQTNSKTWNENRPHDALSFRFEADTFIETDTQHLELTSNHICYVPAHVDYIRTAKRDKLIVIDFKTFYGQATEIETFQPENARKYAELFRQILQCWQEKKGAYKYEASAILNRIFAQLHQDACSINHKTTKIAPSLSYIENNYLKKDFSLQEAAKKSQISETYFRKLFKEEIGISPKKYVISQRIAYAAYLIKTGYFTLQEISEQCGYEDYKHFSTEFKKIEGISPSQYR